MKKILISCLEAFDLILTALLSVFVIAMVVYSTKWTPFTIVFTIIMLFIAFKVYVYFRKKIKTLNKDEATYKIAKMMQVCYLGLIALLYLSVLFVLTKIG